MHSANHTRQPAQQPDPGNSPRHPHQEIADLLALALLRFLTGQPPKDGGFEADEAVAFGSERIVNTDTVSQERTPE